MWIKSRKRQVKGGLLVAATMLASASMTLFDSSWIYQANIVSLPEHAPFNGTVYPVQNVPDWVGLDSSKWDLAYTELTDSDLLSIPYYNPDQLKLGTESLIWGNPEHDAIRNAKITYSVPYLGSYLLDGTEGSGSHPAVDIKIPEGTPIFAIGNGVVTKSSTQSSGFGHHVVIQHNNFPSLEDAQAVTVIYSSYSHMSENLVDVGEVVLKGQQIGLSGSTGTATTPHLHFQIDNAEAPWHPFWPFSWTEISEAGLDFFSAINEGFNQDSARATTINPMMYVQKYMNGGGSHTGDITENEGPEAESYIEEVEVDSVSGDLEFPEVVLEETTEPEIENPVETEVIDDNTNLLFSDVPEDHPNYEAIVYLASAGIIEGYPDGTFGPEQTVNRVEALKFILESTKSDLKEGDLPFKDTSKNEWYVPYLYTGYLRAIVNGHPDGTFKPGDTVNRAEFFKILFNGMSVDINPNVETPPFEDVHIDDWFAAYIAYAKEIGLVDSALQEINASDGMSRGEVAEAMYKLILML